MTLVITLLDTDDKPVRIWNFINAYPVKWTGGDLNAGVDRVPDRVARGRPQRHHGDGGGGMTYTPPPGAANFVKAKLIIDGGTTLDCYFNPTEYSLTKSNEWKYKPVTGTCFTEPEFGGGQPRQMELSLLFDQSSRRTR